MKSKKRSVEQVTEHFQWSPVTEENKLKKTLNQDPGVNSEEEDEEREEKFLKQHHKKDYVHNTL